jgi:hypothetical protein
MPHRGLVAQFIDCADRRKLEQIRKVEQERTGYKLTLKAVLSLAIKRMHNDITGTPNT